MKYLALLVSVLSLALAPVAQAGFSDGGDVPTSYTVTVLCSSCPTTSQTVGNVDDEGNVAFSYIDPAPSPDEFIAAKWDSTNGVTVLPFWEERYPGAEANYVDGDTVIGSSLVDDDNTAHFWGITWEDGLGSQSKPLPDDWCVYLYGMNDEYKVGFSEDYDDESATPAYWETSDAVAMDELDHGGEAYQINNEDSVVGYSLDSTNHQRPVIWQYGVEEDARDLGTTGFNSTGVAYDINDQVGLNHGSPVGRLNDDAMAWPNGGSALKLDMPATYLAAAAYGINDDETIVGGYYTPTTFTRYAFVYADDTATKLDDLVPSGWRIFDAMSINNSGQITAKAKYQTGPEVAVLLTPGS